LRYRRGRACSASPPVRSRAAATKAWHRASAPGSAGSSMSRPAPSASPRWCWRVPKPSRC
jgi:hypothetical protein